MFSRLLHIIRKITNLNDKRLFGLSRSQKTVRWQQHWQQSTNNLIASLASPMIICTFTSVAPAWEFSVLALGNEQKDPADRQIDRLQMETVRHSRAECSFSRNRCCFGIFWSRDSLDTYSFNTSHLFLVTRGNLKRSSSLLHAFVV